MATKKIVLLLAMLTSVPASAGSWFCVNMGAGEYECKWSPIGSGVHVQSGISRDPNVIATVFASGVAAQHAGPQYADICDWWREQLAAYTKAKCKRGKYQKQCATERAEKVDDMQDGLDKCVARKAEAPKAAAK